jgi:hypothetical protein
MKIQAMEGSFCENHDWVNNMEVAASSTPADSGTQLMPFKVENGLSDLQQTQYRKGMDKLLHMMRNPVRELSKCGFL